MTATAAREARIAPLRTTAPARRCRVLQVTEDLGIGGLERVVATLCRTIDRSRFEMEVLCLRERGPIAEELERLAVPVHCLEWTPGRTDYLSAWRVARLIRERRLDVVHTHNTHALLDGGIGARLAGVRTIVHTDHARDFPDKIRYMLAEHAMSWLVHRMVGVSEHTCENLRRYERIPARKLVMVPNGIDGARYEIAVDVAAKRRELGLPPRGPVIGLGARLTEQKGIAFLIAAMARLAGRGIAPSLLVAGEGPLEPELRRVAATFGVSAHVHFVGPRTDMPELLQLLDVYVLPSVWEGLPMAVLEAMASGRAIVASRVGGVPTAIEHGTSGLLVEPRDVEALAEAIAGLLADDALRARLGAAARRRFRASFGAEAMSRRYERLYLGGDA